MVAGAEFSFCVVHAPMADSSESTLQPTSAGDLGRSYAALVGQTGWQLDVPDTAPAAAAQATVSPGTVPPSPLRIVEALFFVGGVPLTAAAACGAVRGLTPEAFAQSIDVLNQAYRQQGRPYAIQAQGPGFVLNLRPRFRGVAEKLYGGPREARLSAQAVDVLALVAYRQPATRQEIDSLRGADSAGQLRQLVRHGLVTIVQRGEAGQREVYYGTTSRFLEVFGLRGLEDLPRTQDLQQL
jgi:segregation and condensation protein B